MSTEESELVVICADNTPAEDRSYVIGAVRLYSESIDQFQDKADKLQRELRDQAEQNGDLYEDQDLLFALQEQGYELAEPPTEIIVG